jgi:hypothetical protein
VIEPDRGQVQADSTERLIQLRFSSRVADKPTDPYEERLIQLRFSSRVADKPTDPYEERLIQLRFSSRESYNRRLCECSTPSNAVP